jgi:hypothetical protein
MKRVCLILIVFMLAIVSRAQTTEKYYLIEVVQPTQEKTHHVVAMERYQSLQASMTATNKLLTKAMDLAAKDWKEKHPDLGPFPGKAASLGRVTSLSMYADKAKADQALDELQAHESQVQPEKVTGAEKQLVQYEKQLADLDGMGNLTTTQQTQRQSLRNTIKTINDQIARQKKKEKDKESNLTIARELIRSRLKQLLAEQNAASSSTNAEQNAKSDK